MLLTSLCRDEYNKVSDLDNKISHEGNDVTMVTKMELVEGELGRFTMKTGQEPTETYNRLKTLENKIRSYGSTRWTDHDVVRLILRSFTVIDPHLVNLIRENPMYTKMTPEEILRIFVSERLMVNSPPSWASWSFQYVYVICTLSYNIFTIIMLRRLCRFIFMTLPILSKKIVTNMLLEYVMIVLMTVVKFLSWYRAIF